MGGGYYERSDDVVPSSSDGGITTSSVPSSSSSHVVGTTYSMNPGLDPSRFVNSKIVSTVGDPVVFALDVTGSMGAWTKIIYDKMPMFYGQILTQKYLQNPAISFCGIGDTTCDKAPLQVSDFGQGKEIDQLIAKMYLEGGGGGSYEESYEMAAYFYLNYTTFYNARKPFFFCTGDEAFYEKVTPEMIEKVMKQKPEKTISGKQCWQDLMKKFNVFLIKKEYSNSSEEIIIKKQWFEALGSERVLYIKEPKACIDVMLGAICLTSGSRTLDDYVKDMKVREQTKERIKEVTEALTPYWEALKKGTIKPVEATNEVLTSLSLDFSGIKANWQSKAVSGLNSDDTEYFKNLSDASANKKSEIPTDFLCPITGELFYDPVIAQDMNTYERAAIEMWFESSSNSPITGKSIDRELITNVVLKKLISDFYNKIK